MTSPSQTTYAHDPVSFVRIGASAGTRSQTANVPATIPSVQANEAIIQQGFSSIEPTRPPSQLSIHTDPSIHGDSFVHSPQSESSSQISSDSIHSFSSEDSVADQQTITA